MMELRSKCLVNYSSKRNGIKNRRTIRFNKKLSSPSSSSSSSTANNKANIMKSNSNKTGCRSKRSSSLQQQQQFKLKECKVVLKRLNMDPFTTKMIIIEKKNLRSSRRTSSAGVCYIAH